MRWERLPASRLLAVAPVLPCMSTASSRKPGDELQLSTFCHALQSDQMQADLLADFISLL